MIQIPRVYTPKSHNLKSKSSCTRVEHALMAKSYVDWEPGEYDGLDDEVFGTITYLLSD